MKIFSFYIRFYVKTWFNLKLLISGSKSDCTMFSFDFEDENNHVNTYSWSFPPGLAESIEETAKAIKNISNGNGTLSRTTSSSSVNSVSASTAKKRKLNQKEQHLKQKPIAKDSDITMMPPSAPRPTSPGSLSSTITIIDSDQTSTNVQHSSTTNICNNQTVDKTIASRDYDALVEENKMLRQKISQLEEQLVFQRETSLRK